MKNKWARILVVMVMLTFLLPLVGVSKAQAAPRYLGINVVLNTDITPKILTTLAKYGKVMDKVYEIDAVTMKILVTKLPYIQKLSFVASATPDAERNGIPVDIIEETDYSAGISTWDLDAVNVIDFGVGRTIGYDGTGVYVAVVDTGLVNDWRYYFPEERIAEEYGISFGGGGGEAGFVSSQPNKWQSDTDSHGTHVTSTILGYKFYPGTSVSGTPVNVNGVAPMVTVIPVKVLNQNGSGWSSVVARGIKYVGDLKAGPLADYPVVINMSLGGPDLDAMEKAAIDYAIAQGVLIVASAGNEGLAGMGYPGAYAPVISVAASGWKEEWQAADHMYDWWWNLDVLDPTNPLDFYIADFSSRELDGQDLDVAAPGTWVRGPYQVNSGQLSYYYLGGTSMASPHVAGIVALMAQKDPGLAQANAEAYLEAGAIPLDLGCRSVMDPPRSGLYVDFCWDADATGAGLITADGALAAMP